MGALRLGRLPADRALDPQGRPALHDRREGLRGRAARPDLPAADRRARSDVSTDADLVTWDLSATYKATENVNFYGRVGTGFRAPSIQGRILFCADFEGGTNPATNCVSVADEEKIPSFEVGLKTEIADASCA